MEYVDKLKKVQGSLDNLETKSKEEIIEFAKLIIKMSINREQGNQYADELIQIAHEKEIESQVKANLAILQSGTESFKLLHDFECITGFRLDDNLIQGLAKGLLAIERVKGE